MASVVIDTGPWYSWQMENKFDCKDNGIELQGNEKILEHCTTHLKKEMFGEEVDLKTESKKWGFDRLFGKRQNNRTDEVEKDEEKEETNTENKKEWSIWNWLKGNKNDTDNKSTDKSTDLTTGQSSSSSSHSH